jgi:hypothetical protein
MSFELILPFLRPIEPLLLDEDVSEIMGNPDASWSCERDGILCQEPTISFDAGRLRTGLEVIANHLGKRLDEDNPRLQAQLPDGSRIAAWIPPLVSPAPAIAIRKFTSRNYTVDDLIARGTVTQEIADFLAEQIRSAKTLLIRTHPRYRRHSRASYPEAEHSCGRISDEYFQDQCVFRRLIEGHASLQTRPDHSRRSTRRRGANVARFLQHWPCRIARDNSCQLGSESPHALRQSGHA